MPSTEFTEIYSDISARLGALQRHLENSADAQGLSLLMSLYVSMAAMWPAMADGQRPNGRVRRQHADT